MNTSFNSVSALSQPYSYSFSSEKNNTKIINDLSQTSDVIPVPDQNELKHDELICLDYALCGDVGNPSKPYCQFYKPANYSDDDPIYVAKLYPWDDSEPIIREIHLIDPVHTFLYTFDCGILNNGSHQFIFRTTSHNCLWNTVTRVHNF